jgi:hypothetical protein
MPLFVLVFLRRSRKKQVALHNVWYNEPNYRLSIEAAHDQVQSPPQKA